MTLKQSKSLLFVTGTRADFGKLEPLAVAARDAGYAVSFFVTGMHMLERYGYTRIEVARVSGVGSHEFLNQRDGDAQDIILAKTVLGFSDFITENPPDLIVVHGDRVEAIACALVAATNYIPCAHIEGGEVSGTIDEMFRHCNSKLAHSHFVSSEQAKRRLMAMGEEEERVHVIGSPELDFHAQPSGVSTDELRARYDLSFDEFGICTFHPVTSEASSMGAQANALFDSLEKSGRCFLVIHPNNDPGSDAILERINSLPADRFRHLSSMRFSYFSQAMRDAKVMIGNSSAGVREAPFLGLPSLDIGTRQTNRALSADVVSCAAHDDAAIGGFLDRYWGQGAKPDSGFGQGNAAQRFVEVLNSDAFWALDMQKNFRD